MIAMMTIVMAQNYGSIPAFDYPENDLDYIPSIKLVKCQEACDKVKACIGVAVPSFEGALTRDEWNLELAKPKECWLKSKFENGMSVGSRKTYFKLNEAYYATVRDSYEVLENTLSYDASMGFSTCFSTCKSNSSCGGLLLDLKSGKGCWLKNQSDLDLGNAIYNPLRQIYEFYE